MLCSPMVEYHYTLAVHIYNRLLRERRYGTVYTHRASFHTSCGCQNELVCSCHVIMILNNLNCSVSRSSRVKTETERHLSMIEMEA